MKIDNQFPERVRKVSENDFLNIYFLNVNISLIIYDPSLKSSICLDNIAVDGTVSQILYIGPFFFFFFIKS